jgi:hypothetical protein
MNIDNVIFILFAVFFGIVALVMIWNNWIGHDPRSIYASRAPFWKFYGYPLWNIIAFFSLGKLRFRSWKREYNAKLHQERMTTTL